MAGHQQVAHDQFAVAGGPPQIFADPADVIRRFGQAQRARVVAELEIGQPYVEHTIEQGTGLCGPMGVRFPDQLRRVRQLRNNVERLMILAGGDPDAVITASMLPQDVGSMIPNMPNGNGGEHLMSLALREAREVFEREYLLAQINRFGGNISRTAEFVGMERSALHRKLKALGID